MCIFYLLTLSLLLFFLLIFLFYLPLPCSAFHLPSEVCKLPSVIFKIVFHHVHPVQLLVLTKMLQAAPEGLPAKAIAIKCANMYEQIICPSVPLQLL